MGTQIRFQGPPAIGRQLVDVLQADGFAPSEINGKRPTAPSEAGNVSVIISLAVALADVLDVVEEFRARPGVSISTSEDLDG